MPQGRPPSVHTQSLASMLYAALSHSIGLLLRASDSTKAIAQLNHIRQNAQDPSLAVLEFRKDTHGPGTISVIKVVPPKRVNSELTSEDEGVAS